METYDVTTRIHIKVTAPNEAEAARIAFNQEFKVIDMIEFQSLSRVTEVKIVPDKLGWQVCWDCGNGFQVHERNTYWSEGKFRRISVCDDCNLLHVRN